MVRAQHNTWATGQERRRLYSLWCSMHARCSNPTRADYARYGGSGVQVCERWASFASFLEDMGPRPTPQHSIDRIDGGLGYAPSNCRWATPTEQQRNRSNNRLLTWNGTTRCVAEWAEVLQLSRELIKDRLAGGWSVDAALSTPKSSELLRTHCRNGHPRTPENTNTASGQVVCRACNRAAVARYKRGHPSARSAS